MVKSVVKARLVARGFSQVAGVDFSETYSPVLSMTSFHLLVALATHYNLHIHQLDVQTAFLHGDLAEEIYMCQPPYYESIDDPTKLCRLQKSLYGLKQSPRQWCYRFHSFMLQHGYIRLQIDVNIYKRNILMVGIYVDDLLLLSNSLIHCFSLSQLALKRKVRLPYVLVAE